MKEARMGAITFSKQGTCQNGGCPASLPLSAVFVLIAILIAILAVVLILVVALRIVLCFVSLILIIVLVGIHGNASVFVLAVLPLT